MIAIGSEYAGFKLKGEIMKYLDEIGVDYIDCGCFSEENVDYPNIANEVVKKILNKECDKGILICRSGIGMSIVANKFKGIRCSKVNSEEEARMTRKDNDSNILALGADYNTVPEAIKIVRMWLATEFDGGRHERRLNLIKEIEDRNMK